jgi:SPASM domain peptide maturase of grasp-with-spasm system
VFSYKKVLNEYADFKHQIVEFINNLIENDFGFLTEEPDRFPRVDTSFDIKKRIYSAVIELDTDDLKQYEQLFEKLLTLDCTVFYLLIREEIKNVVAFEQLLMLFKESRARWVQVIFDKPYITLEKLKKITHDMRISYEIFGAPENAIVRGRWWFEESVYKFQLIEYKSETFDLDKKSRYGEKYFCPTQTIFNESQKHNPFFNQKVCVSKKGEYKNDLSFEKSFGDFRSRSLDELLRDEEFKRLWYLSNDKIEKCRDCHFRYQCVSNSDVKEEEGNFYKVDICNFDPYNGIWGSEDGKQK